MPSFGDFIQQEPHEGQPATDKTEVWVFFDRDNLYVSARMYDAQPDKRVATEMRRDANNLYNNDHFGVSFDGFYDRRNGYGFAVNPLGGMLDWSITNERPNNDWNGVWDVKTGTFANGWTVEIRFPFRSFRFRENGHVWGMNFRRRVISKNEVAYLAPVLAAWGRPAMSKMSVAATVTGIEVPAKGKNIDVKPYGLGSMADRPHALKPPVSNNGDGNAGFDVKWGVRQTLVADLTVNTDFAQVEDDQQVVNLTPVQRALPGEARLLPRGRGHVQLRERIDRHRRHRQRRRHAGQQPEHEHRAAAVLQPPHRIRQRLDGPDPGRRPPARPLGTVAVRPAQHADRRIHGRERAVDQFLRGPREPRPLPAEPRRRHASRAAIRVATKAGGQRAATTSRTASMA